MYTWYVPVHAIKAKRGAEALLILNLGATWR